MRLPIRAPIAYMNKAASIEDTLGPIWAAAKFAVKNPYARKLAGGALAGAAVGGATKMMLGQPYEYNKNFVRGALAGAGVGASAVGIPLAIKNRDKLRIPKVASKWSNIKKGLKIGLPLSASALYYGYQLNKADKKENPNAVGNTYKLQPPIQTYKMRYPTIQYGR